MKIHVFISLEATDWNDYSDIDCSCCEDHHNASVHEAGTDEIVEEYWDVSSESIDRDFNVCEEDITKEDTHLWRNNVDPQPPETNRIGMLLLSFLLLWTSFYGISAAALNHLVQFLHSIFSLLAPLSPPIAALLDIFLALYTN